MVQFKKSEAAASSSSSSSSIMATTNTKKYPIGPEFYQLYEEVGQGASASVYRALCITFDETVAIKILDFEHGDPSNISRESKTMLLIDHPNVLKAHCSFVIDHNLWVVMPYMDGGSCLHILKAAYHEGFREVVIATILRDVLKGLDYLHQHGHIHRDVKAGNILLDTRGAIKLGDLGVTASLYDSGDRQRTRNTFVGTPCWMAPEVMAQSYGYDFKADIWSFGITALELAHGHAPFSKHPPHKVLLMTLQNAPPGLDYERDKKFSKSFRQMIAMCLVKEPSKRPSAQKLLKHSFFKNAKSSESIVKTLLEGLPTLGKRLESLKMKEANLLAQKKVSDGKKEEMSQNEYKRGISDWNFNIDDLKEEASLIHDVEEIIPEKDQGRSSISLFGLDTEEKPCSKDDDANKENGGALQNKRAALPLGSLTMKNLNQDRCIGYEDNLGIPGSAHVQNTSQQKNVNSVANGRTGKFELEVPATHFEDVAIHSTRTAGPSGTNLQELSPSQVEETSDKQRAAPVKLPVANGDDLDKEMEGHVIQQRGRFKVTSDDVDMEKLHPSLVLQKSHSVQEVLICMMKQTCTGKYTVDCAVEGEQVQVPAYVTENSLLEKANDRENVLVQELTGLY